MRLLEVIKEKEEELRTAKAELKRVSVVLASRQDSSEILTRISCLATEHNLKIQEFFQCRKGCDC